MRFVHLENMNGRKEPAATKRTATREDSSTPGRIKLAARRARVRLSAIATRSIRLFRPASSGRGVPASGVRVLASEDPFIENLGILCREAKIHKNS